MDINIIIRETPDSIMKGIAERTIRRRSYNECMFGSDVFNGKVPSSAQKPDDNNRQSFCKTYIFNDLQAFLL